MQSPSHNQYIIEYQTENADFIKISNFFTSTTDNTIVEFAYWRPGRYSAQNYPSNIRNIQFISENTLKVRRLNTNQWSIGAPIDSKIIITYEYYCRQLDAGGNWKDAHLLYINPISCLLNINNGIKPCQLNLNIPNTWSKHITLPQSNDGYKAQDFIELADSPLFAGDKIEELLYKVNSTEFKIVSTIPLLALYPSIVDDFIKFTSYQLELFGTFLEESYTFYLCLSPLSVYHGVEHRRSTIICLGPCIEFNTQFYHELLSICSHELLHTWNVCKIRPKELLPYNLSEQTLFKTGYVVEGFTTYLGDLFLYYAGVFSKVAYIDELNKLLQRHLYSFGNYFTSLALSSEELWVDGYTNIVPNRKVSIYVKGAALALWLDTAIEKKSHLKSNLSTFLNKLWKDKTLVSNGYSETEIFELLKKELHTEYHDTLYRFIYGTGDMLEELLEALKQKNFETEIVYHSNYFARMYGLLIDEHGTVLSIDNTSQYKQLVSIKDQCIKINNQKFELHTDYETTSMNLTFKHMMGEYAIELNKPINNQYFKRIQVKEY
jgi:predicted metalloprotease with PDZ domain